MLKLKSLSMTYKLIFVIMLSLSLNGLAKAGVNQISDLQQIANIACDVNVKQNTARKIDAMQWNDLTAIINNDSISNVILPSAAFYSGVSGGQFDNSNNYDVVSESTLQNCHLNQVPIPQAGWLFGLAIVGFVIFANRRKV